jgi:hypothetical protein
VRCWDAKATLSRRGLEVSEQLPAPLAVGCPGGRRFPFGGVRGAPAAGYLAAAAAARKESGTKFWIYVLLVSMVEASWTTRRSSCSPSIASTARTIPADPPISIVSPTSSGSGWVRCPVASVALLERSS